MGEEYDISVIIPIYKGYEYIDSLVKMLSNISGIKPEILFINDGSPDNSERKLKSVCAMNANCFYYSKQNGGIASARNYGLERARGKFVIFVDQDDTLDTTCLSKMMRRLENENGDFLISNYCVCTKNTIEKVMYVLKNGVLTRNELDVIQKNFLTRVCWPYVNINAHDILKAVPPFIWNCMFRRSFINENHIYFKKFVDYEDDFLFIVESLQCAQRVLVNTAACYTWNVREDSTSHNQKYDPDFLEKRVKLNQWLHCQAQKMFFSQKELLEYDCYLYKTLVIRGYRNICSELNEVSLFEKGRQMKDCLYISDSSLKINSSNTEKWKEKISLFFLTHNMVIIAIVWDDLYKKIKKSLKMVIHMLEKI